MRPSGFARVCGLVVLLSAGVCTLARAQLPAGTQFQYEWYSQGQPISGSLTAAAGSTFTLQVYLHQTAGPTDVLAVEHGLFGGGVRATYGNPTGTPGVIRVMSTTDISYNSGFNDTEGSNSSLVANGDYAQFMALSDGLAGVAGSNQSVLLGAFTFQVQGAAGDSTSLTAASVPTFSDTITFDSLYELDPLISPKTVTVNIIPVPEPASALMAGTLAATGLTFLARRRKRSSYTS